MSEEKKQPKAFLRPIFDAAQAVDFADLSADERSRWQLRLLAECGTYLHSAGTLDQLIDGLIEVALVLAAARNATVALVEDDSMSFKRGWVKDQWVDIDVKFARGQAVPGTVWQQAKSYWTNDAESDPNVPASIRNLYHISAMISVPITSQTGVVLGCLEVHADHSHRGFGQQDVQILESLAAIAGMAIESRQTIDDLTQSQGRLADQKALLHAVYNSSEDGLALTDATANFTLCNQRYAEIWGLDATAPEQLNTPEIIRSILRSLEKPHRASKEITDAQNAVRQDADAMVEGQLALKDGRLIRYRCSRLRWHDGDERFIWLCTDVTDSAKAQAEVEKRERLYRDLFETNQAVKLLIDPADGSIRDANQAATEFYGYLRSDLLSMKISDINTLPQSTVCLEMGKARGLKKSIFRFKHRLASGELRDVEVYSSPVNVGDDQLLFSIIYDISDRLRAEEKLQRERLNQELVLKHTTEGILGVADDGLVHFANQSACRMLGRELADLIGADVHDLLHGGSETHAREDCPLVLALQRHEGADLSQDQVRKGDGSTFTATIRSVALAANESDSSGGRGAVVSFQDISGRLRSEERIQFLAFHDPLTGLPNRALLMDRIRAAQERAVRRKRIGLVLYLDLDNFKNVNDSLGHAVGDLLLIQVAQRLTGRMRGEDTVARLGGDEFVVLVDELCVGLEEAQVLANRIAEGIRLELGRPYHCSGYQLHTTPSIGVTFVQEQAQESDDILRDADMAMYRAKSAGKNAAVFFDPKMRQEAESRLDLETALRQALEHEALYLQLQPRVSIQTNEINGAEALIRWQDSERGLISPNRFIPLAEETGLILQIGDWVIRESIRLCSQWPDRAEQPLHMSINLSAAQFNQPGLVDYIVSCLNEFNVPGECIELEVTEGVLIESTEAALAVMNAIRAHGVRIAVDDFGTGYSSLGYLHRFPIDTLKVDQSFVSDVIDDPSRCAIVDGIINLAQSLKLKTVAEGIETDEQKSVLADMGCDEFQGWLFSPPISPEHFNSLCGSTQPTVRS